MKQAKRNWVKIDLEWFPQRPKGQGWPSSSGQQLKGINSVDLIRMDLTQCQQIPVGLLWIGDLCHGQGWICPREKIANLERRLKGILKHWERGRQSSILYLSCYFWYLLFYWLYSHSPQPGVIKIKLIGTLCSPGLIVHCEPTSKRQKKIDFQWKFLSFLLYFFIPCYNSTIPITLKNILKCN